MTTPLLLALLLLAASAASIPEKPWVCPVSGGLCSLGKVKPVVLDVHTGECGQHWLGSRRVPGLGSRAAQAALHHRGAT